MEVFVDLVGSGAIALARWGLRVQGLGTWAIFLNGDEVWPLTACCGLWPLLRNEDVYRCPCGLFTDRVAYVGLDSFREEAVLAGLRAGQWDSALAADLAAESLYERLKAFQDRGQKYFSTVAEMAGSHEEKFMAWWAGLADLASDNFSVTEDLLDETSLTVLRPGAALDASSSLLRCLWECGEDACVTCGRAG